MTPEDGDFSPETWAFLEALTSLTPPTADPVDMESTIGLVSHPGNVPATEEGVAGGTYPQVHEHLQPHLPSDSLEAQLMPPWGSVSPPEPVAGTSDSTPGFPAVDRGATAREDDYTQAFGIIVDELPHPLWEMAQAWLAKAQNFSGMAQQIVEQFRRDGFLRSPDEHDALTRAGNLVLPTDEGVAGGTYSQAHEHLQPHLPPDALDAQLMPPQGPISPSEPVAGPSGSTPAVDGAATERAQDYSGQARQMVELFGRDGFPASPHEHHMLAHAERPQLSASAALEADPAVPALESARPLALGATEWLGDEHIKADYERLAKELRQIYPRFAAQTHFVPPAVVQMLRFASAEDLKEALPGVYDTAAGQKTRFLFLPVNNGQPGEAEGTHWSLLFIDRGHPQGPQALHYDSLKDSAQLSIAGQLARQLGAAGYREGHVAPQRNGYDCGVAVLAATRELVTRLTNKEPPESASLDLRNVVTDRAALMARHGAKRREVPETFSDLASKALETRFRLSREECQRVVNCPGGLLALKAFVDNAAALAKLEVGAQNFSKDDVLKILKKRGAARAVVALLDKAEALAKLDFSGQKFSKGDIIKVLSGPGTALALDTLLEHAEALAKLEFGRQKLSMEDIVKILGHDGAAQTVKALVKNAEALAKLEFGDQKLSKDDIIKILHNKGAAQVVKVLVKNAEALAQLEFGGQRFSKDDLVKILGNEGASRAVRALGDNAETLAKLEFGGQKLSKDDVLKILKRRGAARAVVALLDKAEALAKLEFSGQKLSKNDIVEILSKSSAAQVVPALVENAGKLNNKAKSRVLAAASSRRDAAAAIRKLNE